MQKYILVVCLLLVGCATTKVDPTAIGTKAWHTARIQEIERMYAANEIDAQTCILLKSQADETRLEYATRFEPSFARRIGTGLYAAGQSVQRPTTTNSTNEFETPKRYRVKDSMGNDIGHVDVP